jgi:hypothetical protein
VNALFLALGTLSYCIVATAIFWVFQWSWLFNAAAFATACNALWIDDRAAGRKNHLLRGIRSNRLASASRPGSFSYASRTRLLLLFLILSHMQSA